LKSVKGPVKRVFVSDNEERIKKVNRSELAKSLGMKGVSYKTFTAEKSYAVALKTWRGNWDAWDMKHSCPIPDPWNYRDADGLMMSYPYNRLYTVSEPDAMDEFRTGSGLAVVRHYTLNENDMNINEESPVGYFIADIERNGPYCMLKESRAVAFGDPRYIGFLNGNSLARGFPEYVRNFNAAFLSLPAVPGTVVKDGCSEKEIIIREYKTAQHGVWYAVVNTSLHPKKAVTVKLPSSGRVTNSATGGDVETNNNKLELTFYPGELKTFRVK